MCWFFSSHVHLEVLFSIIQAETLSPQVFIVQSIMDVEPRKDREILPQLRILTLSLVSSLTFLSMIATIVQLTHPRVTCSLGELVLTCLLEEGHLNKIVFTKTVVNIITLLHAGDKDGHLKLLNSWEAFLPFSSWISHSTEGPSAIFLL